MVAYKSKKAAVTRMKELGYSVHFEEDDARLYYRQPHAELHQGWPREYASLCRIRGRWYVSIFCLARLAS